MNRVFSSDPSDLTLLDLLVDGELSPAEKRELFTKLDQHPDGWRRCALAFLENQSWQEDLLDFGEDTFSKTSGKEIATAAPAMVPTAVESHHSTWYHLNSFFSMAASLLLAFTFGIAAHRYWTSPQPADSGVPITKQTAPVKAPDSTVTVRAPSSTPNPEKFAVSPAPPSPSTSLYQVGGSFKFGKQADSQGGFQVPLLEGPGVDEEWLHRRFGQPSAALRRELERMGHQVDQRREWIRYNLEDGRQVIVPVDQVDVHFGKDQSYH